MSLPYKIRKPAWGSCKPREEEETSNRIRSSTSGDENNFDLAAHLGGDPKDPHTIGGNLQRAILLDMIELRQRYLNNIGSSSSRSSGVAITSNNNNTPSQRTLCNHAQLGTSFNSFKTCFREARFGAVHTRTIPARVDRSEYIQLLYSSCFYLLEESFKNSHKDDTHPLNWEDDNDNISKSSHSNNNGSAFNAIYAVFMLYTLHQTNVLSEAPSPRSQTKRTKPGKFDEKSLKEAWSMLPMGLNRDEDKWGFRRSFRSPVRIDRYNYLLLLRLRDICLTRVEQCDFNKMKSLAVTAETENILNNNYNAPWKCNCGIARDAAHVIDKMLFDDTFFDYCEYHGPHSLEGLAGQSNFYRAHFVNAPKKRTEQNRTSVPVVLTEYKLNEMANGNGTDDDCLLDSQLSELIEEHQSNLSSIMTQLQKSRLAGGGDLQPKQRELVENTLSDIMNPSTSILLTKSAEDSVSSPKTGEANSALEAKSKQVSFLKFQETFSSALCNQIRGSLLDFKEEAEMIRKAVIKQNKARMRGEQVVIDLDDDLASITTEPNRRSSEMSKDENIASPSIDDHKRGKKRSRVTGNDESLEKDDELSIATGAGRNALLSLLSMVEGNGDRYESSTELEEENDDFLAKLSMGGNKSERLEDEALSSEEDNSDLRSFASLLAPNNDDGMGARALQFLLSQTDEKQVTQPVDKNRVKKASKAKRQVPRSNTKTKRCKSDNEEKFLNASANSTDGKSSSDEEFSIASEEGAGTNALAALLSTVNDVEHL